MTRIDVFIISQKNLCIINVYGLFRFFMKMSYLECRNNNKNLTNAVHPLKVKPQKPNGKEEKAPSVEKLTVDDLFRQFEENPPADMAPCAKLWEIFNTFSFKSQEKKSSSRRNCPKIIFMKVFLQTGLFCKQRCC